MKAAVEAASGRRVRWPPQELSAGGGFARCQRWESDQGPIFVKVASSERLSLLEAEADGLRELAAAQAIRVPQVLAVGSAADRAFLALEWIDLGGGSAKSEAMLGERLSRQHRVLAKRHGWHRDNTIGATPQHNCWTDHWPRFFAEQRIGFQLDLAEANGYGGGWLSRGRQLCERIEEFYGGYRPAPSLLHGDLWGGNWAADPSGQPVIFDPAVYYGDREADLAMTRLFGGFGQHFYRAYEAHWPLEAGAERRVTLYNLYHVINHLNLFGGGYRSQAERMIEGLLRAL
jgi:protein-ribulosamine 3-kinase